MSEFKRQANKRIVELEGELATVKREMDMIVERAEQLERGSIKSDANRQKAETENADLRAKLADRDGCLTTIQTRLHAVNIGANSADHALRKIRELLGHAIFTCPACTEKDKRIEELESELLEQAKIIGKDIDGHDKLVMEKP